MDTDRTTLIFIYCLLFITIRSTASVEPSTTTKPVTTAASTSTPVDNSSASSATSPPGKSTSASPATSPPGNSTSSTTSPPGKSTSASSATSPPGKSASSATSPPGKSASVSPATSPPGKSASASPTTQNTPPGPALGSSATPKLSGESASRSAATVDPKTTQPAKLSSPKENPESGKSDNNITNEAGQIHGSVGEPTSTSKPDTPNNKKYFWILLPVGVAVLAVAMYFRYKFFKVHHHPETTDNGTENASFQRTESNRDGVTLLGVKSSGTEEGAAA